jgi:hypothetical protein
MGNNRFDNLTRYIGEQKTRRNMIKAAAGSTLAVLGMGAARRVALGQDVSIESTGYQNDTCVDSGDCRRGLRCDTTLNNPSACTGGIAVARKATPARLTGSAAMAET